MNISHFRRISGYVTQDDALFPLLTVEETLMFSAKLRLPCVVPEAEKIARVKALLNELGLQHVSASRIGNDDIRGISGGERRRVSIGVDVIHDPAVLLLDEPTSGLDSAAALQVIVMLKSMAGSHGRTIILSIHQPGFRILQLFNSILLLANGSVVHHGSLEMLQCRLIAAGHEIPAHVNVLEYAIDAIDCLENDLSGVLAKSSIEEEVPETRANPTLHDLFLLSGQLVDREQQALEDSTLKPPYDDRPSYANSSIQEIMILTHRFSKNIFRTKQLFAARTLQALVAGFGLGTIFMNVGYDTTGMQERVGFFAFSLTFLLSSTTEGLPIFLQERNILMRETSRGAYRVSSYVVANALVLVPIAFGTEEMEAVILIDVLRRAGSDVTVASVETGLQIEASRRVKLVADTLISNCAEQIFDLVVLPILVPVANGSEEMEAVIIVDVLRRANADVVVASVEETLEIVASRNVKIVADKLIGDAAVSAYDLIILPGGMLGADRLSNTESLIKLLTEQTESKRVCGAICASPAVVLETHGLLKGKKATAHPFFSSKLADQSAVDARVVIDGNLITSRGPGTTMEFALTIVEKIFGQERAIGIAEAMVFPYP